MKASASRAVSPERHSKVYGISSADRTLARTDFIREHRPRLFRFLLVLLADPDLASNLADRCLRTALRDWKPSWSKSFAKLCLMRIVVDLERSYWRKRQLCFWRRADMNAAGLALLHGLYPDNQSSGIDRIRANEQNRKVWKALCAMKNSRRVIFLLHCLEDMEPREIADVTDFDEGKVKLMLAEILRDIRAAVTRQAGRLRPE